MKSISRKSPLCRLLGLSIVVSLVLGPAASAQGRLFPSDLVYRGAFAIDDSFSSDPSWMEYGQRGLSYDSTGDPGNSDAYPGSLWLTGHDQANQAFEISISTPVMGVQNWGQLPNSPLLTNPITFVNQCIPGDFATYFGAIEVHGGKIWAGCRQWYNLNDDLSGIWRRNSDLSNLTGPYHAGPVGPAEFHFGKQGGYLFSIPQDFADQHLGGRSIATGGHRTAGAFGASQGPTMIAFDPDNPSDGLDVFWYREIYPDCLEDKSACDFPEYTACDHWNGATWVRGGSTDTLLIAGTKADGPSEYLPGGYQCPPYAGEVLFYDPLDFVARVDGPLKPWEVVPYHRWRPAELWFPNRGDSVGGIAFDEGNQLLYFVEKGISGGFSIIHVYQVDGTPPPDRTLSVTKAGNGLGTVESNPFGIDCGSDCQESFPNGTQVQMIGLAEPDSYFAGWSGDADCDDGQISMYADRSCIATFEQGSPPTYTLSLTKTGTGSGTVTSSPLGIDCGSDCQEDYNQDTIVQLTATPDAGSHFAGWNGAADCSDGTVTMDADTSCAATFNEAPGALGLVAAYGLDEGSGNTAADASGQGNAGTLNGATWTPQGYFGNALSFDGVNDMVTIPDANSLDLTTGMTLEAWVRPTALSGWRTALLKESGSGLAYSLYAHDNAPQPATYVYIGGDESVTGSTTLTLNTWSHLAATYDGSTLRFYTNGQQVGSRNLSGAIQTTDFPLCVGGNTVWGEYFEGRIDEVRLYDRALSVAEILQDMDTPVVLQYIFRDGFETGNMSRWQ